MHQISTFPIVLKTADQSSNRAGRICKGTHEKDDTGWKQSAPSIPSYLLNTDIILIVPHTIHQYFSANGLPVQTWHIQYQNISLTSDWSVQTWVLQNACRLTWLCMPEKPAMKDKQLCNDQVSIQDFPVSHIFCSMLPSQGQGVGGEACQTCHHDVVPYRILSCETLKRKCCLQIYFPKP